MNLQAESLDFQNHLKEKASWGLVIYKSLNEH